MGDEKMKNRYSVIMVVCFLISLVFLGANQNHQWKGTVSEVDGVMVVNNPSEPLKGKIKLDLVEIMRIDPIKYKDIDLVNFSKIFNDKNGNIYLFDADEIKAFQFDKYGNFLGSFIREGQGPGEFSNGFFVSLHFIKNEIWAVDPRKISRFDEYRNFISDIKFRKGYLFSRIVDENHFIGEHQTAEGEGKELQQNNIISLVQIPDEDKEKILYDYLKAKDIGMIRQGNSAFADRWATPRIKWLFDRERQKVYTSINTKYEIKVMELNGKVNLIFDREFHKAKPTLQEKKNHIDKTFKSREWILKAYPNELCAIREMRLLPKGFLAVFSIKGIESLSIDIFDEKGKFQYVIEAPDDISLIDAIYTDRGVSTIKVEEDRNIYIEYRISNLPEIFGH